MLKYSMDAFADTGYIRFGDHRTINTAFQLWDILLIRLATSNAALLPALLDNLLQQSSSATGASTGEESPEQESAYLWLHHILLGPGPWTRYRACRAPPELLRILKSAIMSNTHWALKLAKGIIGAHSDFHDYADLIDDAEGVTEWHLAGDDEPSEVLNDADDAGDDMVDPKDIPSELNDQQIDAEDSDDEGGTGWVLWQGPWIPKPIGVV